MRSGALCAVVPISWSPPAFALLIHGLALPVQAFHDGGDPALVGCADPCRLYEQRFLGNLTDRDLPLAREVCLDHVLPRVGLVSSLLLGCDVRPLKVSIRPPRFVAAVEVDSFGE